MKDIPFFEDAVASFEHFLTEQGHPSKILWLFREDIWKRSPGDVVIRFPSQIINSALARKVFGEGRKKGLIDLNAIATVDDMKKSWVQRKQSHLRPNIARRQ